ncbi:MAG: hypothetical protein ACLT98_09440 [Eggerthellaceae bacterium]
MSPPTVDQLDGTNPLPASHRYRTGHPHGRNHRLPAGGRCLRRHLDNPQPADSVKYGEDSGQAFSLTTYIRYIGVPSSRFDLHRAGVHHHHPLGYPARRKEIGTAPVGPRTLYPRASMEGG